MKFRVTVENAWKVGSRPDQPNAPCEPVGHDHQCCGLTQSALLSDAVSGQAGRVDTPRGFDECSDVAGF
jgi:hypothetical protein